MNVRVETASLSVFIRWPHLLDAAKVGGMSGPDTHPESARPAKPTSKFRRGRLTSGGSFVSAITDLRSALWMRVRECGFRSSGLSGGGVAANRASVLDDEPEAISQSLHCRPRERHISPICGRFPP